MSNVFLIQVLHFLRSSADTMHKFSNLCVEQAVLSPTQKEEIALSVFILDQNQIVLFF
jgi:hypothetical protein